MQRRVVSTFEREQYDVVIASQIDMAPYVLSLVEVPKIFEELELTTIYDAFIQSDNPAKRLRYGLTWLKTSRYTARLLRQFDGCTVVSEVEKRRVEMAAPNYRQVCVVPNGVDVPDNPINRALLEADSLVYSGSLTYGPNYDAIAFFLSEIFPLIRVQRPNVRLYITGKLDEALLDSLPDREGVVFTGYLPDVQSRVSRAWASVVPLRSGGGTRLKILEALGLGVPVITTSKGMEGLDLIPEKDILVADEAPEFASAVVEVLSSPKRREQLSRAGMEAVRRSYDWRLIGPQFCRYVEKIAESGR
jgi:glycosyltransferase involved in cell wall biosynthesis